MKVKITTSSGFTCEISDKSLKNMRLLDALNAVQKDQSELGNLLNVLLGSDQKNEIYDFFTDEDGIVDATQIENTVAEILQAPELKK